MHWLKTHSKQALLLVLLGLAVFFIAQKLRGPVVEVGLVEEGPIEQSIVVSGRVQAPNRIEIGSVITGRVVRVLVEEGAISPEDLDLFSYQDTPEAAWQTIKDFYKL